MTFDPTESNDTKVNQLLDAHRESLIKRLADTISRDMPAVLGIVDQRIVLATLQAVQLDAELVERQYQRTIKDQGAGK